MNSEILYVCPETQKPLSLSENGLLRDDGKIYPFISAPKDGFFRIPNFLARTKTGSQREKSLEMYGNDEASHIYRNFLDWLFQTFDQDEAEFRRSIVSKMNLDHGQTVLITGCGLGDDIEPILELIGPSGKVYAQDLSPDMISAAADHWQKYAPLRSKQIEFSVGDASHLPFADSSFHGAFHFGGINLFENVGHGIAEMTRVVRKGGRVVVGDEGIAPWLRSTDYARMAIANNQLWALNAPIEKLPLTAHNVNVTWVLQNCFWIIDFTNMDAPKLNPHIAHKGRRGGSIWTRYYGQIEGITPETKSRAEAAAASAGVSLHEWFEAAVKKSLGI